MDYSNARVTMVDNQIRTEDVTDWEILRAFLTVPREAFVAPDRKELAYIGKDMPLSDGRMLMAPASFARLLQLLLVDAQSVVLDVGCGSGYASAIMSRLAAKVVALEESPAVLEMAANALRAHAGSNVELVEGPLREGWAASAPYDRILVQGSVEEVPTVLLDQLADGGRLVVVEGRGNAASARLYLKEDGTVSNRFAFNCSVPPLPGFARPPQFVF